MAIAFGLIDTVMLEQAKSKKGSKEVKKNDEPEVF